MLKIYKCFPDALYEIYDYSWGEWLIKFPISISEHKEGFYLR